MNKLSRKLCALAICTLWLGSPLSSAGESGETLRHAKTFPVPSTISKEAQAFIEGSNSISLPKPPSTPSTDQEWKQAQKTMNAHVEGMFGAFFATPSARRMMNERVIAGVTVREFTPENLPASKRDKVLIFLHGGAYVYFSGEVGAFEALTMAQQGQYRVVAVDYRMPPEHPFPAAVDDTVAVYKALLKSYQAQNIGIFGGSAGGGLAAATVIAARDSGSPLPGAVALNTPWSDLSKTGDTYFTNEWVDTQLPTYEGPLGAAARLYAGKYDLKHPLLSPVYADYDKGFPPSILISGTRDLFLSCTVRLHRKLRQAGVPAELHVFEAMWHGFANVPEGQEANAEIVAFFDRHLGH